MTSTELRSPKQYWWKEDKYRTQPRVDQIKVGDTVTIHGLPLIDILQVGNVIELWRRTDQGYVLIDAVLEQDFVEQE